MKLDSYKNYFILIMVYVFTIGIVFYFSSLYENSLDDDSSNYYNDITNTKYDVLYGNVYNYGLEHSEFSIYVSDNYNFDNSEVLFVDSSKVSNKNINRLLFDFGYNYSISRDSVPFYIVFKDGKIKEIVHD